jgi:outer membrane beta-barrel protein
MSMAPPGRKPEKAGPKKTIAASEHPALALRGPPKRGYRYALGRATLIIALGGVLAVAAWPGSGACAAEPGATLPDSSASKGGKAPPGAGQPIASPFDDDRQGGDPGASPDGTGDGGGAPADDPEPEAGADGQPGSDLHGLACLEGEGGNDSDGARRGVQKRDFMKRHRVELSVLGGYYAADVLSSTYAYGASVAFFLSEDFGVEALLVRNPVQFRLEQPFTGFDREQHFQPGSAWNALGAMVWAPIHAKLRWSERRITHADVSWMVGAGQTISDAAQGLTFQTGLGIRVYLSRFLSIRFDVRDFLVPEEVLGRDRITHNIVTLVGLSGWFPG